MILDANYAIVLFVLATLLVSAAVILVTMGGPGTLPTRDRPCLLPIGRLRAQAAHLDIDLGIWVALLLVGPVIGLVLGLAWRLPAAVTVACVVVGGAVLPWCSGFRRATVVQRREDAVVAMVKDLKDRVAGAALNQVVRSLGAHPPDVLTGSMAVLADINRPIEDCLAECARTAGSALMTRFCVYVAVGLKADATAFRELLPTTIIPHLEGLLRQQRARKRALAYQRGVISIMGGVLVVLFTILYSLGPAFRAYYASAAGALTLLVLVAGFLILVGLVHVVLRAPRRPSWDLGVLNRELAKY